MHKPSGGNRWILTLRKLERVPYSHGKLRARWWTEEFDAVVVAAGSYDAAWVPNIPNLNVSANAHPTRIYHSREYRIPAQYAGKASDSPHSRIVFG